jgi:hypothetical protein
MAKRKAQDGHVAQLMSAGGLFDAGMGVPPGTVKPEPAGRPPSE